jgi:hypothetical protein
MTPYSLVIVLPPITRAHECTTSRKPNLTNDRRLLSQQIIHCVSNMKRFFNVKWGGTLCSKWLSCFCVAVRAAWTGCRKRTATNDMPYRGRKQLRPRSPRVLEIEYIQAFCCLWGTAAGVMWLAGTGRNYWVLTNVSATCPLFLFHAMSFWVQISAPRRLSWGFLWCLLTPSRQIPGWRLTVCHDRFLPDSFMFIIHYSFYNFMSQSELMENVVK